MVQDGKERMFHLVKSDDFRFIGKDEKVTRKIVDAALFSP
jgi:hypothetical protein